MLDCFLLWQRERFPAGTKDFTPWFFPGPDRKPLRNDSFRHALYRAYRIYKSLGALLMDTGLFTVTKRRQTALKTFESPARSATKPWPLTARVSEMFPRIGSGKISSASSRPRLCRRGPGGVHQTQRSFVYESIFHPSKQSAGRPGGNRLF